MKLIYSAPSKNDLRKITNWIAEENPARADSFADEIMVSCEQIKAFPEAYVAIGSFKSEVVRRKPHGNYLIFYQVSAERIEILRIMHGAQNYSDLF